ncbi:MAG: hypothetical protein H0X33_13455 [Taibaiella sp.]|nr:hypothetical protein [Taibaiella sp.]
MTTTTRPKQSNNYRLPDPNIAGGICAYCGAGIDAPDLWQDNYSGFLFCKDAELCQGRVEAYERSKLAALLNEKDRLEVRRVELIGLIKAQRAKLGQVDPAELEHKKWLAEMESGDEEC